MRNKILALFIMLVLSFAGLSSLYAGVTEAKRAKLENGLEIVLVENHSSPIVSCNVFVKTGVSTEPADMNGVSHFLEHLLFNGTDRRTQKELYDEVDFFGAYNNAFTREDYTGFQMIIASPFLEKGLDIQSDMLFHSIIPEDKFEKEKGIVIEEIGKDRGNPDYMAELFFKEKAFRGTPYSRPILGTVSIISGIKREDVFHYYKSHYVPNNMILFLFGDFESDKAMKLIKKYFGEVPPAEIKEKTRARIDFQHEKNLYRRRMETGRNYLDVLTEAPSLQSEDFFPFTILISILSEGEDSRLHSSLKKGEEPFVFQYFLNHTHYDAGAMLHFNASLPESVSPEKVANILLTELQKVAQQGISAQELRRAQKSFKSSEIYLQEQVHYYVMMRGEWLTHSEPGFMESFLEKIEKQDLDNVNAVARKYFAKMTPLITISGPQQKEESAEKFETPTYKVVKERDSSLAINKKVLENGMTVIVKEEEASQIFATHLLMKNRSLNEPEGKAGIVDFTHRMLLKGTALLDSADLSGEMKEIGAKIKAIDNPYIPYDDYYTSPLYSYIRFEVLSDQYLQGLKLLKEIVFHPLFPESEIPKVAAEMGNVIRKSNERLSTKARDEFLSNVFAGSKLGNSAYGDSETVQSITREDLLSFHQRYFSPQNMVLSIVSNIPVDEVMKSMEEIFGKREQFKGDLALMPEIEMAGKGKRIEIAGDQQQSYIYAGYLFRPDDEDMTVLSVANAILSDRLAFQLREKQGLAYRVGSAIKWYGDLGLFYASIGTRPGNIEEATKGIMNEIDSFADSEISEREIEKTINSMIGRYAMRRVPGINRAYFMGLSEFQGRGYAYDLDFIDRIKKIDGEQIRKVAKKYLDTSRILLFIAK